MMAAPAQITAKDKNHPDRHGTLQVQGVGAERPPDRSRRTRTTGTRTRRRVTSCRTSTRSSSSRFPEIAAREAALKSGQIDVMHTSNGNEIAKLQNDKSFSLVMQDKPAETGYFLINQLVPALADVRVRQAPRVLHRSRRAEQAARRGCRPVANGPFPPGSPGYLEDNGLPEGPRCREGQGSDRRLREGEGQAPDVQVRHDERSVQRGDEPARAGAVGRVRHLHRHPPDRADAVHHRSRQRGPTCSRSSPGATTASRTPTATSTSGARPWRRPPGSSPSTSGG